MSDPNPSDHGPDLNQATLKEAPTNRSRHSRASVDTTQSHNSGSHSRASISSGLRHRNSNRRGTQQSGRNHAYTTGRDENTRQIFTLAGPSNQDDGNSGRAQNQHQPYVEEGYAELNPAYNQPGNVRPIWGLADPMPRIIRRGMKPSQQEIQADRPKPGEEDDDVLQPTDSQMEQGVGPKLNLNKLDKSIHDATKDRERKYAERYGKKFEPPSDMGQESHTQPAGFLQQLTPPQESDEEGEEELSKPSSGRSDTERQHNQANSEDDDDEKKDEETNHEEAESTPDQMNEGHAPINNIQEELHNHHTLWAVLRTKLREPLAEVLAVSLTKCHIFTCSLILTGFCPDNDWSVCKCSTQSCQKRVQ